jgi:hypothetical protein
MRELWKPAAASDTVYVPGSSNGAWKLPLAPVVNVISALDASLWIVTAAFAITALAVSKTVPSIAPWLVDCAGIGMDAPQRIATESTVLAIISIFVTINSDTS